MVAPGMWTKEKTGDDTQARTGPAFRLRWQRSWPGAENDFTARKGAGFCRIYYEPGGPQRDRWFWTCAITTQLGCGYAETARGAALEAEAVMLGSEKLA